MSGTVRFHVTFRVQRSGQAWVQRQGLVNMRIPVPQWYGGDLKKALAAELQDAYCIKEKVVVEQYNEA